MRERLRRWKRRFYAGPAFLGLQPWRQRGYQSPTLTAALWAYALAVRHITLTGGMVCLCCGLALLYALLTLVMPIHLLAFALLGLLVLDAVAGFVFRPRVVVERLIPERLAAGSEQAVTYQVAHAGRLPLWDLILDPLPLPRRLAFPSGRSVVRALHPGETASCSTTIRAYRRGRYVLPVPLAGTAFPFHLWRWTRAGTGNRAITVYPSFTPLRRVRQPTGLRYQAGGIALSSAVGGSMEFLGTRPYRSGDDPRRMHWRSWARTSYPVVKEFREEYLSRTALIVDTARPQPYFWDAWINPEDETFEAALSLSAAVADYLCRQETIIDLFAAGPEVYRFQGGRSLGFLENILDILACLQPHHGEPFAEFSEELLDEVARINNTVLVLLTWNDVRRDLLESLRAAGVAVTAVLVSADGQPPPGLPAEIRVQRAGDIRSGRCEEL
ncbi:MAG: DUF58 domain-containing protein [Lentisphaerae bacterium]|nr:DUF58 domain-containing protein [Lentisphaerota bacterium]